MYIVFAILAIGVLVFVHELGHFMVARWCNVPVYEFSIGFGPRIWQRRKNSVAYSLRAIPFGGYVSFADPDDESTVGVFYEQPKWKRLLVFVAGSASNVLFALVVGFFLLWAVGGVEVTNQVGVVNENSPAQVGGLQVGDTIVEINGVGITGGDTNPISEHFQAAAGNPVEIKVLRDGATVDLTLTPQYDETEARYLVGINMAYRSVPMPIGQAAKYSAINVGESIKAMGDFLGGLFTRGEGTDQVGSVVGAVSQMADYGSQYGFSTFLSMVIMLSINLAVLNMLPIPALDGFKVVLLGVEVIRRKPIPPEKEGVVNLIGMGAFVILFVVLAYRDIARIIAQIAGG